MSFYFTNERNLAYRMCIRGHCMFSKLAAALEGNPWDTSNQPHCMCDTCFFIQSSCLFIFHHHQNASCYFLPNSGQTNNRCERFGTHCTLPTTSPLPFLLCCDLCATTFALSLYLLTLFPALLFLWSLPIPHLLCGDTKLHPSPTRSHLSILWISLTLFASFVSLCDLDIFSIHVQRVLGP